ncbi:MAG: hypothetical protein MUF53_05800, partial [Gemmatimonadaceae bacterium]|nr:hypothetical protein [Gemmatimonadaceae bacterium]
MRRGPTACAVALAYALLSAAPAAADPYPRQRGVDALHYAFWLSLADDTDSIVGELRLDIAVTEADVRALRLDLANATAARAGRGMTVQEVRVDGATVSFAHADDVLRIDLPAGTSVPR